MTVHTVDWKISMSFHIIFYQSRMRQVWSRRNLDNNNNDINLTVMDTTADSQEQELNEEEVEAGEEEGRWGSEEWEAGSGKW